LGWGKGDRRVRREKTYIDQGGADERRKGGSRGTRGNFLEDGIGETEASGVLKNVSRVKLMEGEGKLANQTIKTSIFRKKMWGKKKRAKREMGNSANGSHQRSCRSSSLNRKEEKRIRDADLIITSKRTEVHHKSG